MSGRKREFLGYHSFDRGTGSTSYPVLCCLLVFPSRGCRAGGWGQGRCSVVHQDLPTQSPSSELHNEVSNKEEKKHVLVLHNTEQGTD